MLFEIATKVTYENADPSMKKMDRNEYERIWKAMIACEDDDEFKGFIDALYGSNPKLNRTEFQGAVMNSKSTKFILDSEKIRG